MTPIRRFLAIGYTTLFLAMVAVVAIMFPWSVDPQGDESFRPDPVTFYDKAYSNESSDIKGADYKESAEAATTLSKTPEIVDAFVKKYGLKDKKVLEVGAGTGRLQDIVEDYTALEISAAARRFFHKPFVHASATNMPFPDNTFDVVWSFRVLEHIPNPERALLEMRRVVKPGGYILLHVATDVDRYAAEGYRVRSYSDFDIWGRIKKATIPIADSRAFFNLYARQVRLLRSLGSRAVGWPSRLRFLTLNANYKDYWIGDSDACISVSEHEILLWFRSRGDRCDNCPNEWSMIFNIEPHDPEMIIRVNK